MDAEDERDFEELAAAVTPRLFRSAWLLCGDRHAAEDLVQETLGRVYSRWRRVCAADNPPAYVQTVLFRIFVSHRRRRAATEVAWAAVPARPVGGADPDLRILLVGALRGLPEMDRAVLVSRYLLDQDVATTARELRISPGAVRSRTSRALVRLREELGADLLAAMREEPR